jgi:hypothetical protein
MVPNAQLFMITQITAMSSSNAVARAAGFWPKPPSPIKATTPCPAWRPWRQRRREPKPIVANPRGEHAAGV